MTLTSDLSAAHRPPSAAAPREGYREATYPHPYPNGWYCLAESEDVPRGRTLAVTALGQRFVVYRSDTDGSVGVLDAHCPHLGANLADGVVENGCLTCPFHRWTFGSTGKVCSIPYAAKVPSGLRARAWTARELDGHVFIWSAPHGRAAGIAEPAPGYAIPQVPGIAEGRLVYRGRHDAGTVKMHLCEFAENSADFQHFAPLHGKLRFPWTSWNVPAVGIHHKATWRPDPDAPHLAYFDDDAVLTFRGRELPRSAAHATITFVGPGSLVRFQFQLPGLGEIVMYQTHTPVAPLELQTRFRWFADRDIPRALVSYVVGNWVAQWGADISIWENKVYNPRPMVIPEDGPIHEARRWFRQFYAA